jgi:hypothetical protein
MGQRYIPYNEANVFASRIVHDGSNVISDGTNGYFANSNSHAVEKVSPGDIVLASWDIPSIAYGINDMVYGTNEIWLYGFDISFNQVFGKLSSTGEFTPHTNPYSSVYITSLVFDGTAVLVLGYDSDTSLAVVLKVNSSGVFSRFADLTYGGNLGSAVFYNGNTWTNDVIKIASDGTETDYLLGINSYGITSGASCIWTIDLNNKGIYKVDASGVPTFYSTGYKCLGIGHDGTETWESVDTERQNGGDLIATTPAGVTTKYTISMTPVLFPYYYTFRDLLYINNHLWVCDQVTYND